MAVKMVMFKKYVTDKLQAFGVSPFN